MVFEPILKRCWELILGQLQSAYRESHEPTVISPDNMSCDLGLIKEPSVSSSLEVSVILRDSEDT